jgi:antitoxin VapB
VEADVGEYLKIDDAETVRLAQELADATGQPVADAIRQALERELRREEEIAERIAAIDALVDDIRAAMPPETRTMSSRDMMDSIYDSEGLPG